MDENLVLTTEGPANAGPSSQASVSASENKFRPSVTASRRPAGDVTYIMPLMSGMPPPPPPLSRSGTSATIASVVRMFLAIDAAF
jgi:hypothetical protein